jgi:hypothetical protein
VPQSKRHPARRPQQRSAKGHRNPAGSSSRTGATAPATSPARRWLERHRAGPLATLHRMPTWLVPALLAVLLIAGLALPWRASGLLLLVIAAFLTWLLALSWPITAWSGRLIRLIAVVAVVGVAVVRLSGGMAGS